MLIGRTFSGCSLHAVQKYGKTFGAITPVKVYRGVLSPGSKKVTLPLSMSSTTLTTCGSLLMVRGSHGAVQALCSPLR